MSGPATRIVETPGGPTRIWEKGEGRPLGFLAGHAATRRWLPVLDRLAERRRVVAPSLPGLPGGPDFERLDDQFAWAIAVRDIQLAAGLDGADLVGASVGGALAAEIAAVWPESVRRLVLIAPFGLFDVAEPVADVFAQRPGELSALLSNRPDGLDAILARGADEDEMSWEIERLRADTAAARLLWPLGDTRLARRLPRVTAPTLLLWGEDDQVIPKSYAARFAECIKAPTTIRTIPGAGHLTELDAPEEVAAAIEDFLDQ